MPQMGELGRFVAHAATVNCCSLGRKSGQVLVTGGDDKKVNLWRVGRPGCLQTLSGARSPVDSVCFDSREQVVFAGSRGGSAQLFDLAKAKAKCSLQGHRSSCLAGCFHPFGQVVATGSQDTNLKVWDLRTRSCVHTYKGHTGTVRHLQFSPDGNWVATGGDDGAVKLWDLTAAKLLHQFTTHRGPISALRFHPNEFLLCSGSIDRTVKFWDLECFSLVSSTAQDVSKVRAVAFAPDGDNLAAATEDGVKLWSWEPCRCQGQRDMGWGRVVDLAVVDCKDRSAQQLLGCGVQQSLVSVWAVDLGNLASKEVANATMLEQKRVHPPNSCEESRSATFRRSTRKQLSSPRFVTPTTARTRRSESGVSLPAKSSPHERRCPDVELTLASRGLNGLENTRHSDAALVEMSKAKQSLDLKSTSQSIRPTDSKGDTEDACSDEVVEEIIEAEQCGNDLETSSSSIVGQLSHTPPALRYQESKAASPKTSCEAVAGPKSPSYDRPSDTGNPNAAIKPNPNQLIPSSFNERKMSTSGRHVSIGTEMGDSFATRVVAQHDPPSRQVKPDVLPLSRFGDLTAGAQFAEPKEPRPARKRHDQSKLVPSARDEPVGLRFSQFLPKNYKEMLSVDDGCGALSSTDRIRIAEELLITTPRRKVHDVLSSRLSELQVLGKSWQRQSDVRGTLAHLTALQDECVTADFLRHVNLRCGAFDLDSCITVLPLLSNMLSSPYESFIVVALSTALFLFKAFSDVIQSSREGAANARRGRSVDLSREERLVKCDTCFKGFRLLQCEVIKLLNRFGDSPSAPLFWQGAVELNALFKCFFEQVE